jgi:di/tricarboxylate transporter
LPDHYAQGFVQSGQMRAVQPTLFRYDCNFFSIVRRSPQPTRVTRAFQECLRVAHALVFATVYLGMILGGLPRLKLDRSGVALLGAIAMIGLGASSTEQAAKAIDLPTILLLFSFMVISAQMRLGGFYVAVTRAGGGPAAGTSQACWRL